MTALLDVDGTLVDSTYHHAMAWYRAFRGAGVDVVVRDVHRAVGMGGDQLVAAVAGDHVEKEMGDALRARWSDEFTPDLQHVRPLPGAADLCRALAARGCEVVWASSGAEEHVEHYLDLLDVRDVVSAWTTSDDVETSKPAPDILGVALDRAASRTAFVVGDSPWDARAAGALDLPSHALLSGGFGAEELTAAGFSTVHATPGELVAALDDLVAGARPAADA